MSAIGTGNHPAALWPGVHEFVMGEYAEHKPEYTEIFEMDSSKMAYEEDVEVTGFGLVPEKAEGAATSYDSHTQGGTSRYTHVARSLGYIVTREENDDNLYLSKSFKRGKMLAFSFRTTKEIVGANILNRGFSSTYTGGVDANELFASDHATLAGNQSNVVSADFSESALEDMLIDIMEAKNSRGLQISLKGRKLVVPPSLAFEAQRVCESTMQPGTANNDINAHRSMGLLPDGVAVNHYLTDADAWFVLTNAPAGLRGFDRKKFEFTTDSDFDTSNMKAKGYERYVFGWSDWRGAYGSAGV